MDIYEPGPGIFEVQSTLRGPVRHYYRIFELGADLAIEQIVIGEAKAALRGD
jgi:hypothetical protein